MNVENSEVIVPPFPQDPFNIEDEINSDSRSDSIDQDLYDESINQMNLELLNEEYNLIKWDLRGLVRENLEDL